MEVRRLWEGRKSVDLRRMVHPSIKRGQPASAMRAKSKLSIVQSRPPQITAYIGVELTFSKASAADLSRISLVGLHLFSLKKFVGMPPLQLLTPALQNWWFEEN